MKTFTRILLITIALYPLAIFSQENSKKIALKHSLGFAAGFTTGYGLSYRFTPNKFGA
ncbi:MAG: hypothetical protein QMB65_00010 [Vicingaceae bacterium]|jgi:hypothetical protein